MAAERLSEVLPQEALEGFRRDPRARSRLLWFLAASPGLVPFLVRHPHVAVALFVKGDVEKRHQVAPGAEAREIFMGACACSPDSEELSREIARFRNAHLVRLFSQDLLGLRPSREIWREWSEVASVSIQGALVGAGRLLSEEAINVRLTVIGMGKLGGGELNFASDIDLMYVYDAEPNLDPGRARALAVQWARAVTSILERPTDEGPSFRVDLALRPGGKDGELVLTVEAAEIYYQSLASPWERWALIKAYPVAGDHSLGESFVEMVRPFVYRRYLDYGSLEEIRALKERIERELRWRTSETLDVKLGRGGIREVEFLVQTLQIINGGRLPSLRGRDTLGSLEVLMREGHLPVRDGHVLWDAYLFLRGVEHRVQMVQHRQTHRLPTGDREVQRISGLMGYDGPEGTSTLMVDLRGHMDRVHEAFEGLLAVRDQDEGKRVDPRAEAILVNLEDGDRSAALLGDVGFREAQPVQASLQRLLGKSSPAYRSPRARETLLRLFPRILSSLIETASPDQTLFRLERFLEAVGPRRGYYALLEENPGSLERLVALFGRSAMLSRVLVDHMEAVDGLVGRGHHRPRRDRRDLAQEVERLLAGSEDPEERLGMLRAMRAQEILRIGVGDLWGALTPWEVGEELSNLAEVLLAFTFWEALRTAGHDPERERLPLCVLGLGSLGGKELSYRSDLDILFLYEEGSWRPPKGVAPAEHLTRIGQRVISWLSMPMREGPGWAVDVRLRPSGSRGPLMVSLEAFRQYHEEMGRTWERQTLLKARPCAGDPGVGARAMEMIDRILAQAPGPDAKTFHEMRMRMERERGRQAKAGGIHLKLGPGGMADIEFLVQFHQMRRWAGDPEVRIQQTPGLIQGLTEAGVFHKEEGQALLEAHSLFKGVENRLGLILDHKGTDQPCSPEEIGALEPLEGVALGPSPRDGEDLHGLLERVMAGVREIYLRHFLGSPTSTDHL